MSRIIYTRDLVPVSDIDLRERITDLEERIEKFRAEHPTEADEVERLTKLATALRDGPASSRAVVPREDADEISRLSAIADELRGASPSPAEDDDRTADDSAEVTRLAAIAKELRA